VLTLAIGGVLAVNLLESCSLERARGRKKTARRMLPEGPKPPQSIKNSAETDCSATDLSFP